MHASLDEASDIGGADDVAGGWVAAADDVCREIVADATRDPWPLIVDRVLAVADADLVTLVGCVSGGSSVEVLAAAGPEAFRWQHASAPVEGTLSGAVLADGRARLLHNATADFGQKFRSISDVGALLAIPLRGCDGVRAVLTVGRRTGRPGFTGTDLALATLLTNQVALVLAHREQLTRSERAVLIGERDRIARGMQARVIGPLFSLGMTLQGAAARATGAAAGHLESGSDGIDDTIKAIRATIYPLGD